MIIKSTFTKNVNILEDWVSLSPLEPFLRQNEKVAEKFLQGDIVGLIPATPSRGESRVEVQDYGSRVGPFLAGEAIIVHRNTTCSRRMIQRPRKQLPYLPLSFVIVQSIARQPVCKYQAKHSKHQSLMQHCRCLCLWLDATTK